MPDLSVAHLCATCNGPVKYRGFGIREKYCGDECKHIVIQCVICNGSRRIHRCELGKIRTCSEACKIERNRRQPRQVKQSTAVCLACKITYPCSPSIADKRKFCSWKCRVPYMKAHRMMQPNGWATFTCINCEKEVEVHRFEADRRKFCDPKCRDEWNAKLNPAKKRNRRTKQKCKWCKQIFYKLPCQMLNGRGKFCSRNCNGAWVARTCQNRVSKIESDFFNALETAGFAVIRQFKIGHFVVDAVAKDTNVAIEFHGDYWHSLPKAPSRDARKADKIAWAGYKLIVVWEKEFNSSATDTIQRVIREARTL